MLLLGAACGFMGLWVRSLTHRDEQQYAATPEMMYSIASDFGALRITQVTPTWVTNVAIAPYSWFTLPLTLLSAWLLLAKGRKAPVSGKI